jgi:GNAT superfamily N-acetyltransferase
MPSPIEIAITNFVDHCQAIPASLGSPGTQTPAFSTNQHSLNIPYPNGITIGDGEHSETQLTQIRQMLAARPPNAETFVVDSYSTLDLAPLGFTKLFDTPWFYRTPAPVENNLGREPNIETVNTPAQLTEFDRAAAVGFDQPNADTVYSTPLLNDPRYRFLFIRQSFEIIAGVQTFTNEDSLGIYTLFTLPNHRRQGLASALVRRALSFTPELPAITNPSHESDHLFRKTNFTHIGTRTIWHHS